MKRIILINQVAGPMFVDIANRYVQLGYEVRLLTGQLKEVGNKIDLAVKLNKCVKYRRNNHLSRIVSWVRFTVQAWYLLQKMNLDSEVMLVSNPPLVPLLSYYFRNKSNLHFRILIYDIYPNILTYSGFLSENTYLYRWWAKTNIESFIWADRLFTISNGMRDVLSEYAPAQRWEVIYPWVDHSFIKPLPKKDNWFIKKHHLEDKIIVEYSGNMGTTHNLTTIIKVAEELRDNNKYHFVFIGDGIEKQKLIDYSVTQKLRNTLFLPWLEEEDLPFSIPAGDLGIVSLVDDASNLSIPSKSFYQMAAGNAIICIADIKSELAKIVLENKCGKVFSQSATEDIVNYLQCLTAAEIECFGRNSREASKKYTKENVKLFD